MVASGAMRAPGIVVVLATLLWTAPASAQTCTEQGARGGEARPTLSGPVQTLDSDDGSFRLHWTDEGQDAPTAQGDGDGNGRPDFIDRILDGLETGQSAFADGGWRPVAPDDGSEGGDAIDVYVRAIDANGYAFHAPPAAGSDAASSCTIHLEASLGDSLDGVLESVAAHELHHCVQYAYTTAAPSWLLEATATHQQYLVFDSAALQAALDVLWITRLTQPDRPVASLGGRYEYAGFLFVFFWESFGELDAERPPGLWEALAEHDGAWVQALDAESERLFDQPWTETFVDFATWNAFACGRDDGAHYDAQRFPCQLDTTVPVEEPGDSLLIELPDTRYAAAYASWSADGDDRPIELTCADPGADGARARVRLMALDRFLRPAEVVDVAGRGGESFSVRLEGDVDVAGSVLAVVASTGSDPITVDCAVERVEPVVDAPPPSGSGCDCGSSDASAALLPLLLLLPKQRRRREPRRRR